MQLGNWSLALHDLTELVVPLAHAREGTMLASKKKLALRSKREFTWDKECSVFPLRPLDAGSCPKCGRRKVRKRGPRRWCPRCGPLTKDL